MAFRITGLSPEPFRHLFGLSDHALARLGVHRRVVDAAPGYPCRVEMREGRLGEPFLLLNHACQPADTPYRATHAIFLREGAERAFDEVDRVPEVMRARLLSLRAYDAADMMVDAEIAEGVAIEEAIGRFFADPAVSYLHAHNAKRGCYSGRIDRAT